MQRIALLYVACTFLLLSNGWGLEQSSDASDTSVEFALAEAMEHYNDGRYEEAESVFARPILADSVTAKYYLALTALSTQRLELAHDRLRALVAIDGAPDRAWLDLGIVQLALGHEAHASESLREYERRVPSDPQLHRFQTVAFRNQDSTLGAALPIASGDQQNASCASVLPVGCCRCRSHRCACQKCAGAEPRPWNLSFLAGYQYDSNVTLSPNFSGLGSGRDISDSSTILAMFGDYRFIQEPTWNVGLVTSIFSSFHYDAANFDVQDYMGGAYANRLLTPNVMSGIRYEFHETSLDYKHFASQHRLVPNLTFLEGDFGHVTTYFEFDASDFAGPPLIEALDQDNLAFAVGATQAIYTSNKDGRVFFGYRFERTEADGSDWDRDSHMATLRGEIPLRTTVMADAEYRHFWDNYDNPNSLDFLGNFRQDQRSEFRSGLQWLLNPGRTVRLDYTFINSNSNVANLFDVHFYRFNRHLLAVQYIIDF